MHNVCLKIQYLPQCMYSSFSSPMLSVLNAHCLSENSLSLVVFLLAYVRFQQYFSYITAVLLVRISWHKRIRRNANLTILGTHEGKQSLPYSKSLISPGRGSILPPPAPEVDAMTPHLWGSRNVAALWDLSANSAESDQIVRMCMSIWVYIDRKDHVVEIPRSRRVYTNLVTVCSMHKWQQFSHHLMSCDIYLKYVWSLFPAYRLALMASVVKFPLLPSQCHQARAARHIEVHCTPAYFPGSMLWFWVPETMALASDSK